MYKIYSKAKVYIISEYLFIPLLFFVPDSSFHIMKGGCKTVTTLKELLGFPKEILSSIPELNSKFESSSIPAFHLPISSLNTIIELLNSKYSNKK